jgi:hypothetical protein
MGCTRHNRGVFEYAVETTYGDGGGAVPTYFRARLAEIPDDGTLGVESMMLEDVTATDIEGDVIRVPGPGTRKISRYLRALQTVAPDATYSESDAFIGHLDSDVIALAMGIDVRGGYGVVQAAGTSTTAIVLDTGQGASFDAGSLVRVVSATGLTAYGAVKSVSTDTLTLHWDLPFTPATGSKVLGGRLLAKGEPTGSLSSRWLGENLDDIRKALGHKVSSLKLTAEENKLLKLDAELFVAKYEDVVSGGDHGGLTEQAEDFPTPIQARDGGLYAIPYTPSTGTYGTPIKLMGGCELDLGIELAPVTGVHGSDPNGISDACIIRRKARLTCTAPSFINYLTGDTPGPGVGAYWQSAFQAGTQFAVIYWSGSGYGQVCWCMMAATLASEPMPADREGRSIIPLVFKEAPFDADGTNGNDAMDVCLRVLFPIGDITP